MNIMASGPITSCQIDGETMETVTDFIFLGSKIMVDGDCSHAVKDVSSWDGKLWQTCMQDKKQHLEWDMEQWTGSNWERSMSRLYIVTLLI